MAVCCSVLLSVGGFLLYMRSENTAKLPASVLQREGRLDDLSSGSTDYKFLQNTPKELIVLTEYSRIHAAGNEKYAQKYVFDRMTDGGMSIDVLADFTKPGTRYNTLEARDKDGKVLDTQTKQLLIPTGEYLPGILQVFYRLTGQDGINQSFAATRQLHRGQPPRTVSSDSLTVAPVACSGILGRNIYRDLVNDGGEVLTNSASLIIFSGSQAYFRQSLQMARFHAVANQRTYIQASMGAPAFVIDDAGEFIVAPEDIKTAFIDFEFMPRDSKTVYTRLGEWPLLIAALITTGFMGSQLWKHTRSRRKN
jgi:apolipoprotein N-acyltransferase